MAALPDHKREAILADIQAGKKRNDIAREHGVSGSTVTKIAQANGLDFDRTQTEVASKAKQADNRARRAAIAAELLGDVERLRKRAWSPYQTAMSGPQGVEYVQLDLPPLPDVAKAYTAIGICLDKTIRIEQHDADSGTEQARSMLAGLSDALGAAARALDGTDGPPAGD